MNMFEEIFLALHAPRCELVMGEIDKTLAVPIIARIV
jgi:hypothetical protein